MKFVVYTPKRFCARPGSRSLVVVTDFYSVED